MPARTRSRRTAVIAGDREVESGFEAKSQVLPQDGVVWQKALWRKQPFPDNYVPPSFLADLDASPSRPRPRLFTLIFGALPVGQHLAVIALFLAIFDGLLVGVFGPGEVGWTCVILGLVGYAVRRWGWGMAPSTETHGFLPPPTPLRPLILPPLILALLSPVLGTLTSATTSDSIWPLAGGLFFVHLLLSDFSTGRDARLRKWQWQKRAAERRRRRSSISQYETPMEEKSLTSSLSLTSALSASVVLASRLPSTAHVFSLVLLSVDLFAGWPVLAKGVREAGRTFSLLLTGSMITLAISLFPHTVPSSQANTYMPTGPTTIFLLIVGLVNVVGPVMLWYSWIWKTRRGGGWEVAKVKLRKRA